MCLLSSSYWLAVNGLNQPNGGNNAGFISRCRVCEGSAAVITLHSQLQATPSCPSGYVSLWNGYSYYMVIVCIFLAYIICWLVSSFCRILV